MLQIYFANRAPNSPLAPVVAACKRAFRSISIASGVINLLTLTGSIFMMQVYDRVLGSQSLPTLAGLSVLAVVAYMFQGWLEAIRGRIFTLIGEKIDADLGPVVHAAGVQAAVALPGGQSEAVQAVRDLDAIRNFVAGTGLVAAFDMPWMLLYIVVAGLIHPLFGLTVFLAAALLIWLTWRTEVASKPLLKVANEAGVKRMQLSDGIVRFSEAVTANGMRGDMAARLAEVQQKYLAAQRDATYVIGSYTTAAKTIRMLLQSFVLGLGAYLAIKGQITSGSIIAGTILVSRALAPIDMAINSWRPFVAAREGHERLIRLLSRIPAQREPTALKPPFQTFAAHNLGIAPPGAQQFSASGVTFQLKAGQAMALVGHSGSGKSSLIRGLVGTWKPMRGAIAFDDTGPEQWAPDVLGKTSGYLPQDIQLFEGTIGQNICRFDPNGTTEKMEEAAQAAGLDGYIRSAFPKTGYDTMVMAGGTNLSGGQRQRIGLARALYGKPFLVVLDEPNSNLDAAGKAALQLAIRNIKARGGVAIVSAHDHNVLAECDFVFTLLNGQAEFFGPRDETMKKWAAKHFPGAGPHAANANTPMPPTAVAASSASRFHGSANGQSAPRLAGPASTPNAKTAHGAGHGVAAGGIGAKLNNAGHGGSAAVHDTHAPIEGQILPPSPSRGTVSPQAFVSTAKLVGQQWSTSWSTKPTKLGQKPKGEK